MTPTTTKNNLRPPLIRRGQVLSRPAAVKPPTPTSAAPALKKEPPLEPDSYLFRKALQDRRMLRIRMLDGSTMQARLVAFGRYSFCVDVVYHSDAKCPQEQRGVVILKHAISMVSLAETEP
jgi:hypothetical protein